MTGAIAGSTALLLADPTNDLRVVTLTVNNVCNLRCPHCYLQYAGNSDFINDDIVELVLSTEFEHLAIVGKEPLVNRTSAEQCLSIIRRAAEAGKTVSLITNGHGLHHLSVDALPHLAWIDVSLDGGPGTYSDYRHASYSRILRNLLQLQSRGFAHLNALNTLSSANIDAVDDMVSAEDDFPFSRIVFSPYFEPFNDGSVDVEVLSLPQLLRALSQSTRFMKSHRTVLLLGLHAYKRYGFTSMQIQDALEEHSLREKTAFITRDPLHLGYIRVTYDGLVLTPYESLHPASYRQIGRTLRAPNDLPRFFRVSAANAIAS